MESITNKSGSDPTIQLQDQGIHTSKEKKSTSSSERVGFGSRSSRVDIRAPTSNNPIDLLADVTHKVVQNDVFTKAQNAPTLLFKSEKMVTLNTPDGLKTVLIKIKDLTKKTGITRAKIKHAKQQPGGVEQLFISRHETLLKLYDAKQSFVNPENSKLNYSNHIDSDELDTLIEGGLNSSFSQGVASRAETPTSNRDTISFHEDGQVSIYDTTEEITHGNMGTIYKVTNLADGTKSVLKVAEKTKAATEDLKNESKLLNFIHSKGTREGIQAPPTEVFTLKNQDGSQDLGYLTKLYDGDRMYDNPAFKPKGMSLSNKLNCLHQVLSGICTLTKEGIKHGDINPNNFLLGNVKTNHPQLVIADFGGCRRYDDHTPDEFRKDPIGSFTDQYLCSNDRDELQALSDQYKEDDAQFMKEYQKLSIARDTLATGRAIWQIITGDEAGSPTNDFHVRWTDEDDLVDKTLKSQLESWGDALPELKTLVEGMCDLDASKRLTPKESLNKMKTIIKLTENNPSEVKPTKNKHAKKRSKQL